MKLFLKMIVLLYHIQEQSLCNHSLPLNRDAAGQPPTRVDPRPVTRTKGGFLTRPDPTRGLLKISLTRPDPTRSTLDPADP